jgi:ferritin-like metal-binding protein YciE
MSNMTHREVELISDIRKQLYMLKDAITCDSIDNSIESGKNIVELYKELKNKSLLEQQFSTEHFLLIQALTIGVVIGVKDYR